MKKNVLFLLAIMLFSIQLFAQNIAKPFSSVEKSGTNWVRFSQNLNVNAEEIFSNYSKSFGFNASDAVQLLKQETDNLGFTHYKYQQNYKGIPVRGAVYIIHSQNGKAISGNGKLVTGLNTGTTPGISSEEAIFKAIAYTGASSYMWENTQAQTILKQQKNNPNATYYPTAALMFVDPKCSGMAANYKLAYQIDIFAEAPMSRKYVFVDAQTGEILFTENRIKTTDVTGTAVTKYAGTQTIYTDSVSAGLYRLRQTVTGGGVETYNMQKGTNYGLAVDFTDTDNYWNNANANQDEAATDAHFAATETYEYYFQKFGRLSYDNADAKLISYVHYDNNYANAFWNGSYMTYGDGDGTSYSALTSIDVCGHEITHAVDENSANLIYQDEMGAMNEGFSDIFGTAIEFFADPAHANWTIGEAFDLTGTGFRSLSDPKSAQLPDTYHGQYWLFNDVFDNGGVHTNCGVLAHWFYIMSEGKVGTNDIGNAYNVVGMGMDTAAAIAYRALTVYLVPSSQYVDARQAMIWSAEDLYGHCSQAAITASEAWYAVGVGFPISDYDLWMSEITSPVTACGYGYEEMIQARLIYNGCMANYVVGDTIPVSYRINGGAAVNDTLILTSDLQGGDTLDFTFPTPANFPAIGVYTIDCWVSANHDNQSGNDSIVGYQFENKIQQNIDMGVSNITSPVSDCHLTNEAVTVEVKFFGCDSIPAGQPIVLAYRVNSGSPVRDSITIPHVLYPLDVFTHTFTVPANLSASGIYTLEAWTEYLPDTLTTNDKFSGYSVKNPLALSSDTVGFEESNLMSMINIQTTHYSNAFTSNAAHNTGTKGFQMTGGNAMDYINLLEFPSGSNTWQINEFLSAKISFCVDASAWSTCNMRLDLKQTHGGDLYTQYLGAGDYTIASNFRVMANGTQIGGTYNPTTPKNDPYLTHYINLDSYAGTKFTVTLETRNISKDTVIFFIPFVLDNAYVDNVCFSEQSQQGIEDNSMLNLTSVYPNPFNDEFSIKYDTDGNEQLTITVADIVGNIVYTGNYNVSSGSNRINLNMQNQPAGVYVLNISNGKANANRKLVKQ